jgi:cytochrome c oxidase subunit IV
MERDDIIEYSLDNHHSEEEGKVLRKEIFKVTIILTLITALEIGVGIAFPKSLHDMTAKWMWIKWGYIILTVIKAAYIVMKFMHLGDERKGLKMFILVPYIMFILYLIWLVFTEATAVQDAWMKLFV